MTLFAYQGTFNSPTALGSVAYTTGFQPSVVLFWTATAAAGGDQANVWSNIIGANQSHEVFASNNAASGSNASSYGTGNPLIVLSGAGGAYAIANSLTYQSTGFTLGWSSVGASMVVHYLALGGTDLTVASGALTPRTTTGTQAVTGLGFQPDMVMFLYTDSSPGAGWGNSTGFGAAADSTHRWAVATSAAPTFSMASANLVSRIQDTTKCFELLNSGGATTIMMAADLVSMDAGGFTLNWTTASATAITASYIALGGAMSANVGTFTKNANTTDTTQTVNAGAAVQPIAYIIASMAATTSTAQSTGWQNSFGAADGTRANSDCYENKPAVSPSQARCYMDAGGANNVMHMRNLPASISAAGTDLVRFTHNSFTPTGFVVNIPTNAAATAYIFPYVTFSPAPVPPVNLTGAIATQAASSATLLVPPIPTTAIAVQDPLCRSPLNTTIWAAWGTAFNGFANNGYFMQPAANTVGGYGGLVGNNSYNLTGCYASINFLQALNGDVGDVATFQMQIDGSNYLEIGQIDNNLVARYCLAGTITVLATIPLPSIGTAGLNLFILESGGTIYFYYGNARTATRTFFAAVANPIAVTALKPNIVIGTYQSIATPGTAYFNGFNAICLGFATGISGNIPVVMQGQGSLPNKWMADTVYGAAVANSASGIVNYWRFDEAAGTTAIDSVGGNLGTYIGGCTLGVAGAATDGLHSAVSLDGTTGYISIGSDIPMSGWTNFGIEAWYYPTTWNPGAAIINRRTTGNVGGFSLEVADAQGHLNWFVWVNGKWAQYTTKRALGVGQWYFIYAYYNSTQNNGTLTVVVNNQLDGQTYNAGPPVAMNDPAGAFVQIGRNVYTGQTLAGVLDEVSLYQNYLFSSIEQSTRWRGATRPRQGYGAHVAKDAPMHWFPMHDSAGASAIFEYAAYSNNAYALCLTNTGTGVQGGATGIPGDMPSLAMSFDGTSGAWSYPSGGNMFGFDQSGFSVEAWIYQTSAQFSSRPIVDYSNTTTQGSHMWTYPDGGTLYCNFVDNTAGNNIAQSAGGVILPDQWNHVVMVRQGATGYGYVNGVQVATVNLTGKTIAGIYPINVGTRAVTGSNAYFWGKMAQVATYYFTLTAAQILNHYLAGVQQYTLQPAIGISDNFTGALNTGLWANTGAGPAATTTGTALQLAPSGVSGVVSGIVSNSAFNMTASSIRAQLTQPLNVAASATLSTLQLYLDANNNYEVGQSGNNLAARYKLSNTQYVLNTLPWPGVPGGSIWVAMQESGGYMFYLYSLDGLNWSFLARTN